MLVLLSICRPAIGQILTILASDWSKQIKILLILIRHLRGLRGFNLTFPTFYRVSSPAQRNLESHKNARYDSCMSVPMPRRRWKVWLTNWRCSQPTRIFPDLLDMTYFIVSCHFSLLRHHLTFSRWHEQKMSQERSLGLLIWLPVLWKINHWKKIKSQNLLKYQATIFNACFLIGSLSNSPAFHPLSSSLYRVECPLYLLYSDL